MFYELIKIGVQVIIFTSKFNEIYGIHENLSRVPSVTKFVNTKKTLLN